MRFNIKRVATNSFARAAMIAAAIKYNDNNTVVSIALSRLYNGNDNFVDEFNNDKRKALTMLTNIDMVALHVLRGFLLKY